MTEFAELNLDAPVLAAVEASGYKHPTPIQSQAIPPALQGRDVLGIAQTGTGKTASFVLPMIMALSKGRARARMPRSLVLAPTRELATQVAESFKTYSVNSNLKMGLLIGGVSFSEQLALIDRGVDVLIATPGRLLDHFERGRLLLSGVAIMVVDEADRMLDMGFIPDIERIFRLTPFTRQTLFFSATMPPEIERITSEFLSSPVRVEVTKQASVADCIEQCAILFRPKSKTGLFKEKRALLRQAISDRDTEITNGIVFCNRKSDVDILFRSMKVHKIDCAAIHGNLDQSVRTRVLDEFRDGQIRFLIASDVAARGLDIPIVSHVFNFDVPMNPEDYVHRIGRTGRAGRKGTAVTLVAPSESKKLRAIEKLAECEITRESADCGAEHETRVPEERNRSSDQKPGRQAKSRGDAKRSHAPNRRGGPPRKDAPAQTAETAPVVGMGDHVPDFLKRNFGRRASA